MLIYQIQDMGFETFNPILNIGGLFIVFVLIVAEFFLLAAIKLVIFVLQMCRRSLKTRQNGFEGGETIPSSCAKYLLRFFKQKEKSLEHSLVWS